MMNMDDCPVRTIPFGAPVLHVERLGYTRFPRSESKTRSSALDSLDGGVWGPDHRCASLLVSR